MKIILASASPRRRELLKQIGLEFEVVVSDVEEVVSSSVPYEVVEELSRQKAQACLDSVLKKVGHELQKRNASEGETGAVKQEGAGAVKQGCEPLLVIGADTVVACDGHILGKPKDGQDAVRMLQALQGRAHEVYTGVTLLYWRSGEVVQVNSFHEATKVHFYPMADEEIASYVATRDPLDKAGAYGIQGLCARYISGIEGDYNNVVGLPVGRLYQELKKWL